ncbi:hypothetical protein [Salinivibrio sp. YCSC6]|uniref:hypothetical protein n=1 Tax=Salinivibrio sp. YCSC6 TaxID=2003370 RepID=UPI000BBC54F6|nr:hypothetical protein [Salinivibrio sp. YCSC6]PCE66946.1 hypothetical protein B6G00_00735 [Salinivibrio sp. YCSC6]QCF36157.1 hypothetical protein E8E00_08250 [Salinivibrio sp. YCSC6]
MPLSDKAKRAYDYFIENQGNDIDLDGLVEATGWKPNTVKTYVNKKWKGTVINKLSPTNYEVIIPEGTTPEQFDDLQTQVDRRAR